MFGLHLLRRKKPERNFEFFENFPVSIIGNVWQMLPYQDAQNFRRTCKSVNQTYSGNRSLIDGPSCDVTIKNDYEVYVKENRVEDLTLLLNCNCGTLRIEHNEINIARIAKIIKSWKIKKINFTGSSINDELLEFFDSVSQVIELHVTKFDTVTVPTTKIDHFDVLEPVPFFILKKMLETNREVKMLRIAVTFASLPVIKELLLQRSQRSIMLWEFSIIHWQSHMAYLYSLPFPSPDKLRIQFDDGRFVIERT